jgi:hypothetical protein
MSLALSLDEGRSGAIPHDREARLIIDTPSMCRFPRIADASK